MTSTGACAGGGVTAVSCARGSRSRTSAGRAGRARSSARSHQTIAARPSMIISASSTSHVRSARSSVAGGDVRANAPASWAALGGLGASPVAGARPRSGGLAQGRDAAGVDAARARQAVFGLKPDHRGAGARAEAAVDRAGPVAAAQQPPLHLAHATRAVRAGVAAAAADAARRPAAREPRDGVADALRQRVADLASVPSRRRRRVTAGAERGRRRHQGERRGERCQGPSPIHPSSPRIRACADRRRRRSRGRGTATRFSPGARAGR